MAARELDVDLRTEEEEFLLRVPKDIALLPLGFAIDSGGSITKLLYRSKEDYTNGKRIAKVDHDDGILRLRHLSTEDSEGVVGFLQEHCDVMETAKTESEGWFVTGLQARHFRKKMEETMKIKVKILSEMVAIHSGLKGFYGARLLLPQLRPLSLSQEAVAHALSTARDFVRMMGSSAAAGGGGGGFQDGDPKKKAAVDPSAAVGQYVMKLMTTDAATLNREFSDDDVIEWPCLNVICGSAAGMIVMKDGGGFEISSFLPIAGKTFVGFGRLLCGAKDFAELIEMAARGDSRKVDVMASDLKVTDVTTAEESDWYNNLPDSLVTYSMGKLAENAASESFSKDDLAAGLLNVVCCAVARTTVAVAKQTKVKCVVFDGSLVNSELVRCTLQKWLLFDSLIQPLMGEQSLKWIFLPHPGFVCVFGTWHQNWEIYKGRQAEK